MPQKVDRVTAQLCGTSARSGSYPKRFVDAVLPGLLFLCIVPIPRVWAGEPFCGSDYFSQPIEARESAANWLPLTDETLGENVLQWRFWGQFGLGPIECFQVVFQEGGWVLSFLGKGQKRVAVFPCSPETLEHLAGPLRAIADKLPPSTCTLADGGASRHGLFPFGFAVQVKEPHGYRAGQYDFTRMLRAEDPAYEGLHRLYRDLRVLFHETFKSEASEEPTIAEPCFARYADFIGHRAVLSSLDYLGPQDDEIRIWMGFGAHPLQGWVLHQRNRKWLVRHLEPVIEDIRFLSTAPIRTVDMSRSDYEEMASHLAVLEETLQTAREEKKKVEQGNTLKCGGPIWFLEMNKNGSVQRYCSAEYDVEKELALLFKLLGELSGPKP